MVSIFVCIDINKENKNLVLELELIIADPEITNQILSQVENQVL
tara:strand:+ start:642 stop:773 length:132 start_codon:yes stop_codon:yes gene_type:complete